jgi:hypothetical protein
MKKKLSLLFSLLLAIKGFSQTDDGEFKKFYFGLKIAPALTWTNPNETGLKNNGTKLSFGYGAVTEFGLTKNYSIVTGLNINAIRGAVRTTAGINEISTKFKIQYLELPITLKMKTNEIGPIKYFGQFGFGNSFRLKAKADVSSTVGGQTSTLNDIDINNGVNLIREALIIGLGFEYNLAGTTSLVTSIAYDNGFTNVGKSSVGKFYSKGVVLNLGVLF